jgi:hypothetical protein
MSTWCWANQVHWSPSGGWRDEMVARALVLVPVYCIDRQPLQPAASWQWHWLSQAPHAAAMASATVALPLHCAVCTCMCPLQVT